MALQFGNVGTDYVWLYTFLIDALMDRLWSYTGFDARVRSLIECENALDLFPRFGEQRMG